MRHLQQGIHNFCVQLFHSLTTIIIKKLFLLSNLNLPPFSLKLLHFVVSLQVLLNNLNSLSNSS